MAEAIFYKEPIAPADPDGVHRISTIVFLDSIPVPQAKGNKWGTLGLKAFPTCSGECFFSFSFSNVGNTGAIFFAPKANQLS